MFFSKILLIMGLNYLEVRILVANFFDFLIIINYLDYYYCLKTMKIEEFLEKIKKEIKEKK